MKKYVCFMLLLFGYRMALAHEDRNVKKRQIYREQVVPQTGGKIPDSAFDSDRLLLNRLQKEGFAIPDGHILEQRNPQVHPYTSKSSRQVYRVALSSDGRYTPLEGRYIHYHQPTVETTYLYPQSHDEPLHIPSSIPKYPNYRKLIFPNDLSYENEKFAEIHSKLSYRPKGRPNYKSFSNYNNFAKHYGGVSWSQLQQEYGGSSQYLHDFDNLFNELDLDNVHSVHSSPPYNFNYFR